MGSWQHARLSAEITQRSRRSLRLPATSTQRVHRLSRHDDCFWPHCSTPFPRQSAIPSFFRFVSLSSSPGRCSPSTASSFFFFAKFFKRRGAGDEERQRSGGHAETRGKGRNSRGFHERELYKTTRDHAAAAEGKVGRTEKRKGQATVH